LRDQRIAIISVRTDFNANGPNSRTETGP